MVTYLYDWLDYLTAHRRLAALDERNHHLCMELAIANAEKQAVTAMLTASRLEHSQALRRIDALEVAFEEAHELLQGCKEMRKKERSAARTWITRSIQPHINAN